MADQYFARLQKSADVTSLVQRARDNAFEVKKTSETVVITDDDIAIFKGLAKGDGTWICRFHKGYFAEN